MSSSATGCDKKEDIDSFDGSTKNQAVDEPHSTAPAVPYAQPVGEKGDDKRKAKSELKAAEHEMVEGDIKLNESESGVEIIAKIEKTSPGKHGFHVHEKGDCSDIPGKRRRLG